MTEREMFERSFQRPKNYFRLSGSVQWEIDKSLGILDWAGENLTVKDKKRFKDHYENLDESEKIDLSTLKIFSWVQSKKDKNVFGKEKRKHEVFDDLDYFLCEYNVETNILTYNGGHFSTISKQIPIDKITIQDLESLVKIMSL